MGPPFPIPDGTGWSSVPLPAVAGAPAVRALAASSSRNVWAVGYEDGARGQVPLALRFDGTEWAEVPFGTSAHGFLAGVAVHCVCVAALALVALGPSPSSRAAAVTARAAGSCSSATGTVPPTSMMNADGTDQTRLTRPVSSPASRASLT